MRSIFDTLLHPRRTPPPPLEVDLAHVMGVGTALWVLGLVASAVGWLVGRDTSIAVAICAAGAVIGVGATAWALRHDVRVPPTD